MGMQAGRRPAGEGRKYEREKKIKRGRRKGWRDPSKAERREGEDKDDGCGSSGP